MADVTLKVSNVGQIEEADVTFGDLTVLVGPQATGKSVFLQLFKLLVDTGAVLAQLKQYGIGWGKEPAKFLDVYLGEGMHGVWHPGSRLQYRSKNVSLNRLVGSQKKRKIESMFFIPAQRVVTLGRGLPRPFLDFSPSDPFAARDFSDKTRRLLESGAGEETPLFPHPKRLKQPMRELLDKTIFRGFTLHVDRQSPQNRLVLRSADPKAPEGSLPFMVWSAGQREFVPLLLGLYWLMPLTKVSRRAEIEWVVIEELEMGLHPKAISTALLLVLELLARGYRVCLSTHSPHVLEMVWALKVLQQHKAPASKVLDLFETCSRRPDLMTMATKVLKKILRVYYFDPETKKTQDISELDPGSDDRAESGWGGLAEFSGHVADVVADVVSGAKG